MPARKRFSACRATRFGTGMYGTAEISQVLLNWVLAIATRPASRASFQCAVARGPGPTTEIEYSPISVRTPPRSIGMLHSLTLNSFVLGGSLGIRLRAISEGHPQSQVMTSALLLERRTPEWMAPSTSPTTSQFVRLEQRGHVSGRNLEWQFVKFSDIVMEKTPPSSGTRAKTWARLSEIHSRTTGGVVHMAWNP